MKNTIVTISVTLLLALTASGVRAQSAGAAGQYDNLQRTPPRQTFKAGDSAPEIYPGETNDVGPQSVLLIKPRRTLVEAIADSQYFYSDNVFLDHTNRQSSGILISTAQVALAPTPYELAGGTFAPRIGYRHQWFDFFEYQTHTPSFGDNDFNAQTFFTDEHWMHDLWTVGVGFEYTRLLSTPGYQQIYSEYVPRWEIQRDFPVCDRSTVSLAYQGRYHFTHAPLFQQPQDSFYDRLDQSFLATYNFSPCNQAVIQPYYRFQYTHIYDSSVSRDDYLQSAGIALYVIPCQYFTARLFAGYDWRESTLDAAKYRQFGAGAGLNITVKF